MEIIQDIINFILHIDKHLVEITTQYGTLTYAILFLIIFCETGLVVTPFLPGDSLLFAAGAICALDGSSINVHLLALLLFIAAVTGNLSNYFIGRLLGPAVFNRNIRFLKKEYLTKTQDFYKKHGGKAIVYSRFIPIIRTFAPFVAGVGSMNFSRFAIFNFIGGFLWVFMFLYAGFLFGNYDIVKNNFSMVVVGIIIISLLPIVIEAIRSRSNSSK